jgi:hypothetical protein
VIIIGYVMPFFGLELLDMAEGVAAFNLPARLGQFCGRRHRRGGCIERQPSWALQKRQPLTVSGIGRHNPTPLASAGLSVSPLPETRGPEADDRTLTE